MGGGGGNAPCYTVYENIKNNTKKAYKYIKTIAVSTLKINGDFFLPPHPSSWSSPGTLPRLPRGISKEREIKLLASVLKYACSKVRVRFTPRVQQGRAGGGSVGMRGAQVGVPGA